MMKTVGQLLRQKREQRQLSLGELSQLTKIKVEHLKALEGNDFPGLPPAAYTQGFIKNLAQVLELNETEILALFRRDYREKESIIPDGPINLINRPKLLSMTPQKFSLLSGLLAFVAIMAYLGFNLFSKPFLAVDSPGEKEVIKIDQVKVSGKTNPNATLTINNQEVKLNPDGLFLVELALKPGVNKITVTALPRFGRENRVERTVFFQVDESGNTSYPEKGK